MRTRLTKLLKSDEGRELGDLISTHKCAKKFGQSDQPEPTSISVSNGGVLLRVRSIIICGLLVASALTDPHLARGAKVAVFADSRYVYELGVIPLLESSKHVSKTFTNLVDDLVGESVVFIPIQWNGDLASALTEAEGVSLQNFIRGGGTLIIHGYLADRGENLVNKLLSSSVSSQFKVSGTVFTRTAQAVGTPFAANATTFNPAYGSAPLLTSKLPPGSSAVYTNGGVALLSIMPHGAGRIVYFAWDGWPTGSQALLNSSVEFGATRFANPATIQITNRTTSGTSPGVASPYPSIINVSNLVGELVRVEVTLSNVAHTWPQDMDILLVGPAGQNLFLISDAGGRNTNAMTNVTLFIADGGAALSLYGRMTNGGIYQPANITDAEGDDTMPSPAPNAPYGTNLAVFNVTNPNGQWRLFVKDDWPSVDTGLIRGWSLRFYMKNAPPPNDDFTNRIVLNGDSFYVTGTNIYATKETGEPSHAGNAGGKSLWWSWTPTVGGSATVDTYGANFDTLLAVYIGDSFSNLTSVTSNDDYSGNPTSQVSFEVSAGTEYQIAVDGYRFANATNAQGVVGLFIANYTPPLIIECPGSITVFNLDDVPPADPDSVQVSEGCTVVSKTLLSEQWQANGCRTDIVRTYRVIDRCGQTNDCSQQITVKILPQPPIFTVNQTTTPDGILVQICVDIQEFVTGYQWTVFSGGVNVSNVANCCYVLVSPTNESNVELNVQVFNPCGNVGGNSPQIPTCSICLSRGSPSLLSGTTGSAIGPVLSTTNCGSLTANARWYKLIATNEAGMVTVSTEGSTNIDTLIAVYIGPQSSPTNIFCNENASTNVSLASVQSRLSFAAEKGVVYWIVVDPRTNNAPLLRVTTGFEPQIESFGLLPDRTFELRSSKSPAIPYKLQMSTNLTPASWTTVLTTNLTTNYPYLYYRDTNTQSRPQRYYRIAPPGN